MTDIEVSALHVLTLLRGVRFPLSDEKRLQADMAQWLSEHGVPVEREVRLGGSDIIDMMVGGLGIEVKIKGSARSIYRQCKRYCLHERVQGLLLATSVAMGMPAEISGRPVFLHSFGRAWL